METAYELSPTEEFLEEYRTYSDEPIDFTLDAESIQRLNEHLVTLDREETQSQIFWDKQNLRFS